MGISLTALVINTVKMTPRPIKKAPMPVKGATYMVGKKLVDKSKITPTIIPDNEPIRKYLERRSNLLLALYSLSVIRPSQGLFVACILCAPPQFKQVIPSSFINAKKKSSSRKLERVRPSRLPSRKDERGTWPNR